MAVSQLDVIEAMTELTDGLVLYADSIDREVELIIRTDGTAVLMIGDGGRAAGEAADCFDECESFESIEDLVLFLKLGTGVQRV